jgi:amidase
LIPPSAVARLRAGEDAFRERLNRPIAGCDALLTPTTALPPPRIGQYHGRGALWTLNGVAGRVPYNGIWNVTGQPVASVPVGLDSRGLPLSVQLVGRPNDEATLLSLAAQIEAERPWAQRRPALAA